MTQPAPPAPSCFKSYDVRGTIGVNLTPELATEIGRAFARVLRPVTIVIGHDSRPSSPQLTDALATGLMAEGVKVLDLQLAATEEVYFAASHLGADGGIAVTASHNPITDNGMKFVGRGSRPLSAQMFAQIKQAVAGGGYTTAHRTATRRPIDTRDAYATHLSDMIDVSQLRPMRILVNAGSGVAGPAFDAIAARLVARGAPLDITRIHHQPDSRFPHGIPNPLLPRNQPITGNAVRAAGADIGIAWDGDADRCFFFDHTGAFVAGEYIVALLARAVLQAEPGATIVHDPRVIWNTQTVIAAHGGNSLMSRTGHAHMKHIMRDAQAAYGGEMSAHHYFRDFMYCDSGMIPWIKVIGLIGHSGQSLAQLVAGMRAAFPSSGELNFALNTPAAALAAVHDHFANQARTVDHFDGLSMAFPDWRFNLRQSATEPLVRLNVESRKDRAHLAGRTQAIITILEQFTRPMQRTQPKA